MCYARTRGRRHHALRRDRGIPATSRAAPPAMSSQLCASTTSDRFDVEVHRWGATRELVWSARGVAGPRAADARRCRRRRVRLGAADRDPDRAVVAERLLPRDDDRPRRTAPTAPSRTPGSCVRAARPPAASCSCSPRTRGTRTTTGAAAASTRAARRSRSAVRGGAGCWCVPTSSATTASRRPRRPGEAARRRRRHVPGVPLRARLSRLHGLGRVVHLRPPLRRVGGASRASTSTTRSRATSNRSTGSPTATDS